MKILGELKSKIPCYVNENKDIVYNGYMGFFAKLYNTEKENDEWKQTIKPEWIEHPKIYFEMNFIVSDWGRGQSSTVMKIKDIETNAEYMLAPKGIFSLLQNIQIKNVKLYEANVLLNEERILFAFNGKFSIEKQGMNYYIMPYYQKIK